MYYDVLVATKHKANSLFTYSYNQELEVGQIVLAPFRSAVLPGVIIKSVKPFPKAKPLEKITQYSIPPKLLSACLSLSQHTGTSASEIASLLLSSMPKIARESFSYANSPLNDTSYKLSSDQQAAIKQLQKNQGKQPVLLMGVTGSGKTRIYQELIDEKIKNDQSCLVLSPEIGLSGQITKTLTDRYGDRVLSYNSSDTKKHRERVWHTLATTDRPWIISGPRSALFLPIGNLGLIVLDEAHDDSYKQSNAPSYHSLHVASLLARTSGSELIYGSATPNVTDYYNFKAAEYPVVVMRNKAIGSSTPVKTTLVDMRLAKNKGSLVSAVSRQEIARSLAADQQSLVYFNRRGSSRLVQCESCGWQAICDTCEYNLTLHKDENALICHSCGHKQTPPSACPKCSSNVLYGVPGVKAIYEQLKTDFPEANIYRFDSDNSKEESLQQKLQVMKTKGNVIMVGTQVISKGLDLPLLSSVIVVRAEASLSVPDYRSEERMYQQITQLKGRVGRGHIESTNLVVQTYSPDNITLRTALDDDWETFYKAELKHRQQAGYPPYRYLAVIRVRRKTRPGAIRAADKVIDTLVREYKDVEFTGPAPALQEKKASGYEWIINAYSKKRSNLVQMSKDIATKEIVELDPTQLF